MAQENAEILAGVCIVQAINPGNPVCYGGIPHAFDMRTTQMIFAGPEQALMAVGMTQMGKFYNLPVYINVGLTDSKIPDAQAGIEAGITLACGTMAGADIFGHLGIAGVDQATSLPMLVMQHEIISYVERLLRGVEVTDKSWGLTSLSTPWLRAVSSPRSIPCDTFVKNYGSRSYWTAASGMRGLRMEERTWQPAVTK